MVFLDYEWVRLGLYQFLSGFSLINRAILFFLINGIGKVFASFKKKVVGCGLTEGRVRHNLVGFHRASCLSCQVESASELAAES